MNNAITQFEYGPTGTPVQQAKPVRIVEIDGEPWFVAKDVCEVLGLAKVSTSLNKIPDSQKDTHRMGTTMGIQQLSVVSEAGLYRLIMRSDRPEAEPFIAWVTEEVLPMIRKTNGAYLSDQKAEELLFNPDLIIGLARVSRALSRAPDSQKGV